MERMSGETLNIVADNIQKLKQIFPEVFNEDKVDFEKLEAVLGEYKDNGTERYNFTWPGKSKAIRIAQTPSTGTLRPCKEESKDWDTTENLYIEGDNLEVLKLLQKSYYGKVKMIYIDPPYNTGNDFVYEDDFKDNVENYLAITGQKDSEGNKTTTNTESNGRYHSNWLNMMYPRLKLARNLLTDDGVIFISIDDNEVHNSRKICDEIFGENNFIASLVWAAGRKNDSKYVSISHEYVLCYVKSIGILNEQKILWREKKQGLKEIYAIYTTLSKKHKEDYLSISKELKQWYRDLPNGSPAKNHSHYNCVDKNGIYFPSDISWPGGGGPKYEVLHPITKKPVKIPNRGWVYPNKQRMQEMIDKGNVHFGVDEKSVPCKKTYLKEKEYSTPYSVFYKDGRAATKRLRSLMDAMIFQNPKDEEIIESLIEFTISNKDSIILDFFSGSATTAHAVMQLNVKDNGKRKFIMVQLPEETGEKSEAYKAGYKTICEIGKERIRRAGDKIKEENKDKEGIDDLDIGFKVFKLDSSNINRWDSSYDQDLEQNLLSSIDNIKEGRNEEDILYEVLLKYGIDLNMPIEEHNINGKKIFDIGFGAIIACLDDNISLEIVDEIGKLKEELQPETCRVVFMDNGFSSDSVKTNAVQILKRYNIDDVKSI